MPHFRNQKELDQELVQEEKKSPQSPASAQEQYQPHIYYTPKTNIGFMDPKNPVILRSSLVYITENELGEIFDTMRILHAIMFICSNIETGHPSLL